MILSLSKTLDIPDFSPIITDYKTNPFEYLCFDKFLSEKASLSFLTWLENTSLWTLKQTDFYQQWEFKLTQDTELPNEIRFLTSHKFITNLRTKLDGYFNISHLNETRITVHKMLKNQEIEIHNDFLPDIDAIRIITQFNRGWTSEQGGQLVFYNSYETDDIHRTINPAHNTAVAMKISNHSLHSVTPILAGDRYTLVYTLENKLK
ncbi:MAG: hypothetical protein BGO76_07090 [Caedibacter sp. 38-128]|nr:2OG-Fe(II) oxygenase [Holosporales bacterium]OJX04779.1 MAG: hypothetical protein BGO76_07090 [Caedibacter sp. 38-128]